jgi:hypothetical protein
MRQPQCCCAFDVKLVWLQLLVDSGASLAAVNERYRSRGDVDDRAADPRRAADTVR